MKQVKLLMGMPITIDVIDKNVTSKDIEDAFNYLQYVDNTFSTYKSDSEISKINRKEVIPQKYSNDMKFIFDLAEKTKKETHGYFDMYRSDGYIDPSGVVKGWAILQTARMLKEKGFQNLYVDAGGDIQVYGMNDQMEKWSVGIRNPFNRDEIVKVVRLTNHGIATSGTYIRGQHVYDPYHRTQELTEIVSLTVIGPDVLESDRFATAAFAMQKNGIYFIEKLAGFEGYMIDKEGKATYTSGFDKYILD